MTGKSSLLFVVRKIRCGILGDESVVFILQYTILISHGPILLYSLLSGVISERDYIGKIALLGRTSKDTKVKEIATHGPNVITAKADETVESCMEKMMANTIRHLPIVDSDGKVTGMISIKDLVKTVITEKEEAIKVLSDFALGKGGHFGSE